MIDTDEANGGLITNIKEESERENTQIQIKSTIGTSNLVVLVSAVDDQNATAVYRFITS